MAFDLDGTLIPDTTVCVHLAPWVGHDELPELERRYDAGEITNVEIAELHTSFYSGRTRGEIWQNLADISVIDGIPETVAALRERGLVPVIATVTIKIAAEFFAERYGFEACSGCEWREDDDGVLTGEVSKHFEAQRKVDFVREVAASISAPTIVAVGDSTSDIPLFHEADLAIALNASRNAKEVAEVHLETRDLRDVLDPIDRYISACDSKPDPRRE